MFYMPDIKLYADRETMISKRVYKEANKTQICENIAELGSWCVFVAEEIHLWTGDADVLERR